MYNRGGGGVSKKKISYTKFVCRYLYDAISESIATLVFSEIMVADNKRHAIHIYNVNVCE